MSVEPGTALPNVASRSVIRPSGTPGLPGPEPSQPLSPYFTVPALVALIGVK